MKKLFLTLMFGLFALNFASAALTDDLTGYFKLDEATGASGIIIDSTGLNNGTNVAATNTSGKIIYGYDFDTIKWINLTESLEFYDLTSKTISFWYKNDANTLNDVAFSETDSTSNNGYFAIQKLTSSSSFKVRVTNTAGSTIEDTTGTANVGDGNWHHVVYKESSGNYELWVDGINDINGTFSKPALTTNSLNLGSLIRPVSGYTDCVIDEVGIWSRELNSTEVSKLYNSGNGLAYPLGVQITSITLTAPENGTTISDIGFNFSTEMDAGAGFNVSNVTYYIWNSTGAIHNQTTVNINGNRTANNTLFIDDFVLGDYTWTAEMCYSNSTWSNCTYASNGNFTFLVAPFSTITESYFPTVLEGDTADFSINISIITFERLSSVSFIYNGTSYPATFNEYATNQWYFSRSQQIPQVDGIETVEFYWNVILESGYSQNSTIHNQTISEIQIDDCSSYTSQIFNFTIVDEKTQDVINGASGNTSLKIDLILSYLDNSEDVVQYSHFYDEINPARVCMNNTIGNSTLRMDAVVEYTASGKYVEFYNIQNYEFNVTNANRNITLYNLAEDEGQEFKVTYKGQDFIPVTDLILQIQRKYIDEGEFKTVEIPMSGTSGYTIAHLVPNDVIYNLIFIKDGEILDTFTEVVADCQNPDITECEINLNSLITGLDLFNLIEDDEFSSSLDFDKDTREVSSTFAILSGVSGLVTLNVSLSDNFGNNTACTDTLTAAGGTLSCTVPDSFGNSTIHAVVVYDGDVKNEGFLSMAESPKVRYRGVLIFTSIIMLFLIFGIGLSDNPYITAAFFVVGALLLVGLNLFYSTSWIGAGATILWFVIAIIAVIMKGGSKR